MSQPFPRMIVPLAAVSLLPCLALAFTPGSLGAQEPSIQAAADGAKALHQRATDQATAQQPVEAEKTYLEADAEYEKEAPRHINDPAHILQRCRCRNDLAELRVKLFRFAEARAGFAATVPVLKQHIALHPQVPDLRFELARTHDLWGYCLREAELFEEAAAQRGQAVEVLAALVKDFPAREEYRRKLVGMLENRGAELQALASWKDAEAWFQEAVRLGQKLVADYPDSPENVVELAVTYNGYALLVRESGRFPQAAEMIREAIRLLRQLEVRYPDKPQYWRLLPVVYRNLAQPLHFLRNSAEMDAAKREALRVEAKLSALPDATSKAFADEDKVVGSLQTQDAQQLAGQQTEVDKLYQKAAKQAGEHPDVPAFQGRLAAAKVVHAVRLVATGAHDEAWVQYTEALELLDKLAAQAPDVPKFRHILGEVYATAGVTYLVTGHPAEGERCIDKGCQVLGKLADDFPAAPRFRFALSEALLRVFMAKQDRGDQDEALKYFTLSLGAIGKLAADFPACPEYRRHFAQGTITRAEMLLARGDLAAAEKAYREGVAVWARTSADFTANPQLRMAWGNAYTSLGTFLARADRFKEAEGAYGEAVRIHQALAAEFPNEGEYRAALAADQAWCGMLMEKQQRLPAAVECYSQNIAHLEAAFNLNPRQRDCLANLRGVVRQRGFTFLNLGKYPEYQADMRRGEELDELLDPASVRIGRINRSLEQGKVAAAVKEADDLFLNVDLSDSQWYDLAGCYTRAVVEAGPEADRKTFARRAVDSLRQARDKGYKGKVPLGDEPQFRGIAGCEEFKQLAVEKGQGQKKSGGVGAGE